MIGVLVAASIVAGVGLADIDQSNQQGIHVVQQGDTLGNIAYRYGTSVQALALANHIDNVDLIHVGQVLRVVTGVAGVPQPQTYTEGGALTRAGLLQALKGTSWPEWTHHTVANIAWCESNFRAWVRGDSGKAHGLLQIRTDAHPELVGLGLLTVRGNLEAGYRVWQKAGQSFRPWSCY